MAPDEARHAKGCGFTVCVDHVQIPSPIQAQAGLQRMNSLPFQLLNILVLMSARCFPMSSVYLKYGGLAEKGSPPKKESEKKYMYIHR